MEHETDITDYYMRPPLDVDTDNLGPGISNDPCLSNSTIYPQTSVRINGALENKLCSNTTYCM